MMCKFIKRLFCKHLVWDTKIIGNVVIFVCARCGKKRILNFEESEE